MDIVPRDDTWFDIHGIYGQCSTKDLSIDVVTTGDPTIVLDTFIHEIYHAIWYFSNILDSDREERVVTTLTTAFTAVLIDNPELVKLINKVTTIHKQRNL